MCLSSYYGGHLDVRGQLAEFYAFHLLYEFSYNRVPWVWGPRIDPLSRLSHPGLCNSFMPDDVLGPILKSSLLLYVGLCVS